MCSSYPCNGDCGARITHEPADWNNYRTSSTRRELEVSFRNIGYNAQDAHNAAHDIWMDFMKNHDERMALVRQPPPQPQPERRPRGSVFDVPEWQRAYENLRARGYDHELAAETVRANEIQPEAENPTRPWYHTTSEGLSQASGSRNRSPPPFVDRRYDSGMRTDGGSSRGGPRPGPRSGYGQYEEYDDIVNYGHPARSMSSRSGAAYPMSSDVRPEIHFHKHVTLNIFDPRHPRGDSSARHYSEYHEDYSEYDDKYDDRYDDRYGDRYGDRYDDGHDDRYYY